MNSTMLQSNRQTHAAITPSIINSPAEHTPKTNQQNGHTVFHSNCQSGIHGYDQFRDARNCEVVLPYIHMEDMLGVKHREQARALKSEDELDM